MVRREGEDLKTRGHGAEGGGRFEDTGAGCGERGES